VETDQVILAFVVAPLVVPLVFAISTLLPHQRGHFWAELVIIGVFGLPVAYIVEIFLGIPAWIIFRASRIKSPLAFALGGAAIGLLVDVIQVPSRALHAWSLEDTVYVAAALSSALLFRVIAFRTSPGKRLRGC
jgi:hypothetical protein